LGYLMKKIDSKSAVYEAEEAQRGDRDKFDFLSS
jgi:hypothetical protein